MKTLTVLAIFSLVYLKPSLAYKAAVFEHYPVVVDGNPENTILKNLESYRIYANLAKDQNAQILVFPEYGLTTKVDDPERYAIDVNSSKEITELATIATERRQYLVVNLLEKVEESNKKTKYYNTDLVFNRNGDIILKYRKINLINEPKLTKGDDNQTVTFVTDFGITFGIFTGNDILYDNPSRRVFDDQNVVDVVVPTMWYSTEPFLTSLSVQHGYSVANGVNLLVASYGKPKEGHGGSGIYRSDGSLSEIYISDSPSSKRIIQEVAEKSRREDKTLCPTITPFALPGDLDQSNVTNFITYRSSQISDFVFKNLDFSKDLKNVQVCDGSFCCTFDFTVNSQGADDHYKLVAYEGPLTIQDTKINVRVCSVLACENDSKDSCGGKVNVTTRFTKISVKGNLKNEEGTYYVPTTQDTYLLPISQTVFCNTNNGTNSSFVQLQTIRAQSNVVVFGLFGKTVAVGGASSVHAFSFFVVVAFALSKYFVF